MADNSKAGGNAQPKTTSKAGGNAQASGNATQGKGVEITYVPQQEGDPVKVTWNRIVFEANKPQLVADTRLVAKAKNNPWFRVAGEKQAARGYDPVSDTPTNPTEYRAYAVAKIKANTKSADLSVWWSGEEAMRADLGVGTDDIDYITKFYDARFEQLTKAEQEAQAR